MKTGDIRVKEIIVRPVETNEEPTFRELMATHHYLGFLRKIGNTIWYVAKWKEAIVAILSFSSSALRCAVREEWIGWDYHHQYDRLNLIANNSRFLILPEYHHQNVASRILSLCQKRIQKDWQEQFGSPMLGLPYKIGVPQMKLSANEMKSLPDFFKEVKDPRRKQARIHRSETILAIAAAAILCGVRGYKGIYEWAEGLSPVARARFNCRYKDKKYIIPSLSVIRDFLIRVDPVELDRALQGWNEQYAMDDESLAIDGKTMRNAIDDDNRQTHIMSVIGHRSMQCYTQKKLENCP